MRIIFLLLFVYTGYVGVAQTLDFPDYRSKRDNLAKVTDPVIKNDLVFFTLAGLDQRVGRPMAISLPVTQTDGQSITFSGDQIQVRIKAGTFNQAKHKLGYIEKNLVRIDNKPYFGNYGNIPQRTIESVVLIQDKDTIAVPAVALADLYEPLFMYSDATGSKTHDGVYQSADKHTIYIYMLNKEGNNYYEVTWVIRDKKFLRRVVDAAI